MAVADAVALGERRGTFLVVRLIHGPVPWHIGQRSGGAGLAIP
jgi:hypothetical protein